LTFCKKPGIAGDLALLLQFYCQNSCEKERVCLYTTFIRFVEQVKFPAFNIQHTYLRLRRYPKTVAALLALAVLWLFCLPAPLFDDPVSIVLEDDRGNLLGARIAADGQWRFPSQDTTPEKYNACVVAFEDKRFWWHPGVDPASIARALWTNTRNGRVASGGSTLTMQVIRLSRNNPPRTIWEKITEAFLATRLELTASKQKILSLYAANAPFGGNVVGLEAASWRYYGKQPDALSWAEAATMAVLPTALRSSIPDATATPC